MNGVAVLLTPFLNLADGLRPVFVVIGTEVENIIADENYLPIAIDNIVEAVQQNAAARKLIIAQLSHFFAQQEWMDMEAENADYNFLLREQRMLIESWFNEPGLLKSVVSHVFSSCKTAFNALGDLNPSSPAELSVMLGVLINCFRVKEAQAAAA